MDTKKLRQKILDLAIHGKLVPQDPSDEPASVLLERIKTEKERLIKEGKIKKNKKSTKASDTPHYENVPFEVPESWVWCKLDDLAFYKKGPFGSSLTKAMFVPKGKDTYKVYEQKNAIQKDHKLGSYYISTEKYCSLSGFAVHPNDIIVSCAGTIGETYVLPQNIQEGIINQALMLIRLYNREIEGFYLLYFDFILKQEAYKESKGTAIKNIPPFDVLKNFFIPIPPKEEQKRIMSEVDKWMSFVDYIDTNSKDLQLYIKHTKSKILDLAIHGKLVPQDPNDEPAIELLKRINPGFTPCDNEHSEKFPNKWCYCSFKDIFIEITSKPYQILQSRIKGSGKYPVISQSANFIEGYSDENNVFQHKRPCIIFGDHTRNVKYIDFDFIVGADGVKILSPKVNEKWAYYLIVYASAHIENKGYSRHFSQIVKFSMMLPPLAEQQRIVSKIEKLFEQLDYIENSLEA